jgi:ARG and Rhodanese-Phosphatase-superfamily-associated Protein domain
MTAVQTHFEPAVRQWMAGLTLGTRQRIGTIDLIPLVRAGTSGEADLLAHEALAAGALEVLEKDGGVVQELLARNKAPRPVVIIEGETLVGARQNRIVAHTVVVAAGQDVIVPVGCMEHGRWHFKSAQFASGASPSEWKMRREIKASVMRSRSAGGAAALNQSALWDRVDQELATAEVHSSTADYHELVERRMGEAASLLAGVRPVDGQVGLLALSDGLLVAIDLVGSSATWGHLAERALRSLLPAASDPEASASRPEARRLSAEEWLRVLGGARIARRPAIGLGDDFELAADGLIGSGVWLDGRPAHLSAFAPA